MRVKEGSGGQEQPQRGAGQYEEDRMDLFQLLQVHQGDHAAREREPERIDAGGESAL